VPEIQVEGRIAEEPIGERCGSVAGAISPALEEQNAEPRGEPADLLACDVGAKLAVEVVERLDRLVQVAAVPQTLDNLRSGLEERFLAGPVTTPALDLEGSAVVFKCYREVIRGEIEVAELLGLVVPIRNRLASRLEWGFP